MTMLNWRAAQNAEGGITVVLPELGKHQHWPDISLAQMQAGKDAYESGLLMQVAFPFLTDDRREFLMSGLSGEEWEQIFGEGEEDGNDFCTLCEAEEKAEDSDYCHLCLAEQEAEDRAARECPLCGRESCSGFCQEFPR